MAEFDSTTDALIRGAALRWLERKKRTSPHVEGRFYKTKIPVPELGIEVYAIPPQKGGIWKPKRMQACLSVLSSHKNIYNDFFSEDDGLFQYKYRDQGGYDHSDNRSLRLAMEHHLPVLYFMGVASGVYQVEAVRVRQETADKSGVLLSVEPAELSLPGVAESNVPERIHRTTIAKIRLHQGEFRHRVMGAYRKRCAVCSLKHVSLLEAAHIVPHAEGGRPEVPNGLSLCRIHHGAYDHNILGIDPDYRVHINREMLEERDGPMLKHGFQEMDQQRIVLPRDIKNRPDRDKLERRYTEFRNSP